MQNNLYLENNKNPNHLENDDVTNDKHKKYKKKYIKNMMYWGLGIENEIYLEFNLNKSFSKLEFINNNKRERYSVDYNKNYKEKLLNIYKDKYLEFNDNDNIKIPILINSHSFIKTDANNNSITLYKKDTPPNPNFNGKTLHNLLIENCNYYAHNLDETFCFDGDTIEFMTNNFYNANLYNIMDELDINKSNFIKNLNLFFKMNDIFNDYGEINIMKQNYPFATYLTNINNISMFNNGTLHYNITLPTELDENCKIINKNDFINIHSKAIKLIQYFEPFLISIYGTPDPFSCLNIDDLLFSKSSQRCAISRYISLGTYDSDKMEVGKILIKKISDLEQNKLDYWWFNEYYKNNGYVKLEDIGYDINFNKHYNHGIEIRFFDNMSKDHIEESFIFIIYLMDIILNDDNVIYENPIYNKLWNELMLFSIRNGKNHIISDDIINMYEKLLNMKIIKKNINDIYYEIYDHLKIICLHGKFSTLTIKYNKLKNKKYYDY